MSASARASADAAAARGPRRAVQRRRRAEGALEVVVDGGHARGGVLAHPRAVGRAHLAAQVAHQRVELGVPGRRGRGRAARRGPGAEEDEARGVDVRATGEDIAAGDESIIRQALRAGSDDPPGMRAILPTFQNTV